MNDEGRKEDASVRIVGREFIIVVVVVFSSLSFTLGFFVGKNSGERKADSLVQTPPQPAEGEGKQSMTATQLQPQKPDAQAKSEAGQVQAVPEDLKTAGQTVSAPAESRPGAGKTAREPKEVSDAAGDSPKKRAKEEARNASDSSARSGGSDALYTVQLGALKKAGEARNLKTAYAKKGYKTYITVTKNKGKEKIYKVRTGEFKEKKDAEILALRLKKNEGLAAFVTVKND
jgi:cell division septation protein DedD